ncbi:hypothetical protein AN958_01023, partial [Leucoagaricus sp. SymC.cos]
HFHKRYESGRIVADCKLRVCKTSENHMHGESKDCDCPAIYVEKRTVENLFHTNFANCKRTAQ